MEILLKFVVIVTFKTEVVQTRFKPAIASNKVCFDHLLCQSIDGTFESTTCYDLLNLV